jgi:hypothetical protein
MFAIVRRKEGEKSELVDRKATRAEAGDVARGASTADTAAVFEVMDEDDFWNLLERWTGGKRSSTS